MGLAATLALAHAAQATTYSNLGNGDVSSFGSPDTTTYGKEFTAPGGALQSWSFWTDGGFAGDLKLVVAAWNGSQAVGPALYDSAAQANDGSRDHQINFSGINTNLKAGSQYVVYFTIAGVSNPTLHTPFEISPTNGGLNGSSVYLNSNGVDPLTITEAWNFIPDLRFSAVFGATAVPEPATLGVLAIGLVGLVVARRRKFI